jgi:hypothetical protein
MHLIKDSWMLGYWQLGQFIKPAQCLVHARLAGFLPLLGRPLATPD